MSNNFRPVLNSPSRVLSHLRGLEKSSGNLESVCTQCGQCCFCKININKSSVLIKELPCRFMVLKSNSQFSCSVYNQRHQVASWCRDLAGGMISGVYPVDCPYTKSLVGYKGPVSLLQKSYGPVRDAISSQLPREEISEAHRDEDLDLFYSNNFYKSDVMQDMVYDWLSKAYPDLTNEALEYIAPRLAYTIDVREYLSKMGTPSLIKSFILQTNRKLAPLVKRARKIAKSITERVGIDFNGIIEDAINAAFAYNLGTSRFNGFESVIMSRWFLEKALNSEVLNAVLRARLAQIDDVIPEDLNTAVLIKSIEYAELGLDDLPAPIEDLDRYIEIVKSITQN